MAHGETNIKNHMVDVSVPCRWTNMTRILKYLSLFCECAWKAKLIKTWLACDVVAEDF